MLILHTLEKRRGPPRATVACAAVTNLKNSCHTEETANQTEKKVNLSSLRDPSKTTKILPRRGFGTIFANINKQKPWEAVLTDLCGQYSRDGGNFGALKL